MTIPPDRFDPVDHTISVPEDPEDFVDPGIYFDADGNEVHPDGA